MHIVYLCFLALGCFALFRVLSALAKPGFPRGSRQIWQCEDTGKYYVYQDRAGHNNVRQDWWREVKLLSDNKIAYIGNWFKRNVGYPPKREQDMSPFISVSETQLKRLHAAATA